MSASVSIRTRTRTYLRLTRERREIGHELAEALLYLK
jgi:hypothetical protein